MPRLTFRIRTLLVLLLVALPPLIAFGVFAVASTAESPAVESARRAHEGAKRATAVLANALDTGREGLLAPAADAAFAEAALTGDLDRARARYEELAGRSLAGWSSGVAGGDSLAQLAGEPAAGDVAAAGSSGPLVRDGRLYLVVTSPLTAAVDGADALTLVTWRDATDDLLPQIQAAAGGSVALDAGGELVVAGDRSAALVDALRAPGQPHGDLATGPDAPHAAVSIALADSTVGRLAVLPVLPPSEFSSVGLGLALSVAGSLAVLWAVLLAAAFARSIGGELRRLAEDAERVKEGEFETRDAPPAGDELGRLAAVHHRLAASLAERNRQIGELAERVASLPVGDDPALVARGVADAAASVTGEPIWSIVVLRASPPDLLPPAGYGGPPLSLTEGSGTPAWVLGAWQSLTESPDAAGRTRLIDTPHGPFVVALVAAGEPLDAVLLAPWAGRRAPSAAEFHLFTLLARHASTAIEHAILYARLHAQTTELERLASVQADFLRGVSHDLQTPLTSISVLSSELRARGLADPTSEADLRSIEEQAERLRRMVAQLLVVSRLEAGAVTPRQEVFRAEPIARRAWNALRPAGRTLELTADGASHLVVADADRLEQVIWALLENAVRYGMPGTTITVRLTARTREPSDDALGASAPPTDLVGEIEVSDIGMGMDEETQQKAFNQFYRSDAARALVPDGSGIGLYAARGLVEAMGGSLRVTSRPGVGSNFRISLPAEPAEFMDSASPEGESVWPSEPAPRSTPDRRAAAARPSRPGCSAAGSTRRIEPG